MEFSQEPIPDKKSSLSVQRHGIDTPFRHHAVVQQYIEDLVNRNDYQNLIEFKTTVERIERDRTWRLILRKEVCNQDYWWAEDFDAVIDASGHYSVPFVPRIEGLPEFANAYPGAVEHTKSFRDPQKYKGKVSGLLLAFFKAHLIQVVVTVGASISGPDVAAALAGVAKSPLHCVVRGKYHPYFGDWAFRNVHIKRHPPISRIKDRTVFFEDGTSVPEVDHIILGTGYSWTMHFLPNMTIRNNRIPGLYQHIFSMSDPTLLFVGAVAAGFTFKVFEWQAVLAARYLAGRVELPPIEEQEKWEQDRIRVKGDGVPFTALYPNFEEYFEELRKLAGEPKNGNKGRRLPPFDQRWRENFDAAHLRRIAMWKELNRQAKEKLEQQGPNVTRLNGHAM